jgi:Zn finger protein HypA/HybF involved in hydrogenase expression
MVAALSDQKEAVYESERMKEKIPSVTFSCPRCKQTFEFDAVGEYEFVPCPICGTGFMTTRKGAALTLKPFDFNQKTVEIQSAPVCLVEVEC